MYLYNVRCIYSCCPFLREYKKEVLLSAVNAEKLQVKSSNAAPKPSYHWCIQVRLLGDIQIMLRRCVYHLGLFWEKTIAVNQGFLRNLFVEYRGPYYR